MRISQIPDRQAKKIPHSVPKFWLDPLPGEQPNPRSRQDIYRFPDSRTVFWTNPGSREYPSRPSADKRKSNAFAGLTRYTCQFSIPFLKHFLSFFFKRIYFKNNSSFLRLSGPFFDDPPPLFSFCFVKSSIYLFGLTVHSQTCNIWTDGYRRHLSNACVVSTVLHCSIDDS